MANLYEIAGIIESVDKYARPTKDGKTVRRINVVIRTSNERFDRHNRATANSTPKTFEFSVTQGHTGYAELESAVRGMSILVTVKGISSRTVEGKTFYNPDVESIDVWFATDEDPTIWSQVDYSIIREKKPLPTRNCIE